MWPLFSMVLVIRAVPLASPGKRNPRAGQGPIVHPPAPAQTLPCPPCAWPALSSPRHPKSGLPCAGPQPGSPVSRGRIPAVPVVGPGLTFTGDTGIHPQQVLLEGSRPKQEALGPRVC